MSEEYTEVTYLQSRLNALWLKIEQAEEAGDDDHVTLWMALAERLEGHIARAIAREETS